MRSALNLLPESVVDRENMKKSLRCATALFALLGGCGQSSGEPVGQAIFAPEEASRPPNTKNIIEATAPGYVTAAGHAQECLGRLIFDVRKQVQWATTYAKLTQFSAMFSEGIFDQGDQLQVGNMKIAVFGPLDPDGIEEILSEAPAAIMQSMEVSIGKGREYVANIRKGNKSDERTQRAADSAARRVVEDEETLLKMRKKYRDFDAGIVGSIGYSFLESESRIDSPTISTIGIYYHHAEYVYFFESKETLSKTMSEEQHKQDVVSFMKKFRARRANEIPAELGICIPYGFIADDGTTQSELKHTFRWPDAPGVLYSIQTGDVRARALKFPPVTAAARASLGLLGSVEEEGMKSFVTERIGPRSYKIGGLTGEQGGVALKVNKKGKTPYETYSVFTGYSGWLGSAVLPYILVDMRSHTVEQAPKLKQNPPPFNQSMGRLENLLKSIRLRPTVPAMPELAKHSK